MKNLDLKVLYSKIKLIFDNDPLKIDPNPKKDWTILFILFTCTILASGWAHYYLYGYFQELSSGQKIVQIKDVKTVSHEEIEKVLARYNARETSFNILMAEKPAYKDPSK